MYVVKPTNHSFICYIKVNAYNIISIDIGTVIVMVHKAYPHVNAACAHVKKPSFSDSDSTTLPRHRPICDLL